MQTFQNSFTSLLLIFLTKYRNLSDTHPDTWVQWEDIRLNSPFFREDKPSVLDMSEAVIARLQEKAGAPKDKILKVIFLSIHYTGS